MRKGRLESKGRSRLKGNRSAIGSSHAGGSLLRTSFCVALRSIPSTSQGSKCSIPAAADAVAADALLLCGTAAAHCHRCWRGRFRAEASQRDQFYLLIC